MCQDSLSVPSAEVKKYKKKALYFLTLEGGTDKLSWNSSKELPLYAV